MQTALSNEKSNVKMMKISTLVSIAIKGIINDTFEIRPRLIKHNEMDEPHRARFFSQP